MRIPVLAIDGMGGDYGIDSVFPGIEYFMQNYAYVKVDFVVYGDSDAINKKYGNLISKYGIKIIHSDNVINSHDKPSTAIRNSKGSSMRMAIESVAEKEADACISSGSTGALMGLSKMIIKTHECIDRPAICSLIPNDQSQVVFLDLGANTDCSAKNLFEFAVMGSAFARVILKRERPRIGILNIGSEESKGKQELMGAFNLITQSHLGENFIGYIEPNNVMNNMVDVVVTDGFTGNIFLKTLEGSMKMAKNILTKSFRSNISSMIGYSFAKSSLKKNLNMIDPNLHNGAMFIGLNGISIKSHGSASEVGFANAIRVASEMVLADVNQKLQLDIGDLYKQKEI